MDVTITISEEGWQDFLSFMEEREGDIEDDMENFGLLREVMAWVNANCYT